MNNFTAICFSLPYSDDILSDNDLFNHIYILMFQPTSCQAYRIFSGREKQMVAINITWNSNWKSSSAFKKKELLTLRTRVGKVQHKSTVDMINSIFHKRNL